MNTPDTPESPAPEEWTPEDLQALEAAGDPGPCNTCPACGCPGMT